MRGRAKGLEQLFQREGTGGTFLYGDADLKRKLPLFRLAHAPCCVSPTVRLARCWRTARPPLPMEAERILEFKSLLLARLCTALQHESVGELWSISQALSVLPLQDVQSQRRAGIGLAHRKEHRPFFGEENHHPAMV